MTDTSASVELSSSAGSDDDRGPRSSVTRVKDDWYVVCETRALGNRPLRVTLFDVPLCIFRTGAGEVGAVLDRCPHRGVPLTAGKVEGDHVQCRYHGWEFDCAGRCKKVPGLDTQADINSRAVPSYAAREQDGYIWVYATPDEKPAREPFRFPLLDDKRYTKVAYAFEAKGSLYYFAENALDVPHTAFLHGGLFRKPGGNKEINVVVRRFCDRAEAEYIGESVPKGLMAKMLAPQGGEVTHVDRFIMPCITQVEYALGEGAHIITTAAITPISDFRVKIFGMSAFRLPIPGARHILARLVKPIALLVLKQDADILELQTEGIAQFHEEQIVSTKLDTLSHHILRLLREAERGERAAPHPPQTRKLTMLV